MNNNDKAQFLIQELRSLTPSLYFYYLAQVRGLEVDVRARRGLVKHRQLTPGRKISRKTGQKSACEEAEGETG